MAWPILGQWRPRRQGNVFRATAPGDTTPISFRPEDPDADHLLTTANGVARDWQKKLGTDVRVVMGGSLVSRTLARTDTKPVDMDVRFLTDNPEHDYPKIEAATGLKLRKVIDVDEYPSGKSKGYLVEGPLTTNGVTFDVEGMVRTPSGHLGITKYYPKVMTPDELAAFRADKARLSSGEGANKADYKALKKRFLNEALRRVAALGGPKRVAGLPSMGESSRRGYAFASPPVALHPSWEVAAGPPSLRDIHFANASHDVDRRLRMTTTQRPAIGA
jgi:hypothetical protein